MVKTFYVMRHDQTRFNLQGRIQGACDSPLTELGIEQAKSARQHFKEEGITFTRVYSSTQERACDTAGFATERTDYIRLKGLKEMDFGSYEAHQEYSTRHYTVKMVQVTVIILWLMVVNPMFKFINEWLRPFVRF